MRSTVIGTHDLLNVGSNSSTTVEGTWVIQAGPQARVTASQVVIDAEASLTLSAGGHHLVIHSGGIFSSVAIVEGGVPMAGLPPLSAAPTTASALQVPLLPRTQRLALMARQPICAVCEAAQQQIGEDNA
jgi:type VI secretion system secreted protein VgrG